MRNDQAAAEPKEPSQSKPQKGSLDQWALIAEAIQRQTGEPRTFRSALREPTVVAALITVLIGGLAATGITGIIQWGAQVREFNQAWLKSRGDEALVSYKEYLDQERELIRRTYSSIGSCIGASDRLTGLTRAVWRKHFVDPVAVEKQKQEIRDNYNQSKAKWHSEGQEIGLLMGYYHPGRSNVTASWTNVEKAVSDYLDCAENWYDQYPPTKPAPADEEVKGACKQQYSVLANQLVDLTASLESARRYAWTGWESPQELRTTLYGK